MTESTYLKMNVKLWQTQILRIKIMKREITKQRNTKAADNKPIKASSHDWVELL